MSIFRILSCNAENASDSLPPLDFTEAKDIVKTGKASESPLLAIAVLTMSLASVKSSGDKESLAFSALEDNILKIDKKLV